MITISQTQFSKLYTFSFQYLNQQSHQYKLSWSWPLLVGSHFLHLPLQFFSVCCFLSSVLTLPQFFSCQNNVSILLITLGLLRRSLLSLVSGHDWLWLWGWNWFIFGASSTGSHQLRACRPGEYERKEQRFEWDYVFFGNSASTDENGQMDV